MKLPPLRRPHPRWPVVVACLAALTVMLGLVGWGAMGAWQAYSDNPAGVAAETVSPLRVASIHCSGTATPYSACADTSGTVTLSWSPPSGSPGLVVFRAGSPGGPWTAVATLAGTATSYADTSAAYNAQYYYQVISEARPGWAPGTDLDMALSLPPTGGTDATSGGRGTALTAADLAAMATANGTGYTTTTPWGSSRTSPLNNQTVTGMSCVSAARCWASTQQGQVWETTDGGATWTPQRLPGNRTLYGITFVNAADGWAVGQNGQVYVTANGGATWSKQTVGPRADLYGVAFVTAQDGWAVGQGGTITATTDGGATWVTQASGTGQQLNGIDCVSTSRCWAVGDGGTILATADGGATWTAQPSGTGNNLSGVSCVSASLCWAVGGNGTVLVTTDGGATWSAQQPGTGQSLNAVAMVSATTGWAAGVGGVILHTTDGGATWTLQGSGINQPINAISAVSSSVAWVGLTPGGGIPSVLGTVDGGASWYLPSTQYVQWSFGPTVASGAPVGSVVVTLVDWASQSPSSQTQADLLVSGDGGATWTPFPLAAPTIASTTQVVNVTSAIGSATAVAGLTLRYAVSTTSGFTSTFDLVHVDVN